MIIARMFWNLPAILAMVLSSVVLCAFPALGLEDGRIGVLYVGCVARSQPFWMMRSDPLFRMQFVQATIRDFMMYGPMPAKTEADVHRMVRLYMPRTDRELTENYDAIVLSEANVDAVGLHIDKLARAVSEGGLGLVMAGGWQSFGAASSYHPWSETSIGRLLPTEDIAGTWDESVFQRLVIDRPDHELMSSVPWESGDPALGGGIWHHNRVTVKLGADQLAHVVPGSGREDPLMVTWRIQAGPRTFALTSESCRLPLWTYAYDYVGNLMIYLDERPVPQDVDLVHAARSKMLETRIRRSLLAALLDFCESFGANTHNMMSRLEKMDEAIASATPRYLELRFDDMMETYRHVGEILEEAEEEAVKLKNRTLLWVYLIEWLAVSGTATVCGFLLWSLMLRRRLYREVQTTRLAR